MFSGFYLALLLILVFLIVRVVSFEWRTKSETPGWRSTWTWANTIGSFGASLLWGIGLSCLVYGTPIDSDGDFTGRPPGSLQPVQRVRRNRGRRALRIPWRDIRRSHDGRTARRAEGLQGSLRSRLLCSARRTSSGRSRSAMTATTRISSARAPPLPRDRGSRACDRSSSTQKQRASVRDDRARDDLPRGDAVRLALPARDGFRAPASRTA